MTKITFEQLSRWKAEEEQSAISWHKGNMGEKLTPEMEQAYRAGFDQGWGKLNAILRMHGAI